MKIIKSIALTLIVIVVAVFVVALFLPSSSSVVRTAEINAPQALVFDLVSNHQNFRKWSPWSALDPDMKVSIEGPEKGLGSKMVWQSENKSVGSGTSEYIEYEPYSKATTKLKFDMGGGEATFLVEINHDTSSKVTWTFETEHEALLERYFGLMMDSWVGETYEQGLASLKTLAESTPLIQTQELTYNVDGVELKGYVAFPTGKQNTPGILVIHEWWGHNDYVRSRAEQLAELGYTAFALDMYGDGKLAHHPEKASEFMMQALGDPEALVARFDAASDLLKTQSSVDPDKISAIGYCFGGAIAMSMARAGKDLDGIVSFHGSLQGLSPIAEGNTTPMLVLNGEADPFITAEQITTFKAEMDASSMPYEFVNYEGALHAFTNPLATEKGGKFGIPLAYDEQADKASWQAMRNFFDKLYNE